MTLWLPRISLLFMILFLFMLLDEFGAWSREGCREVTKGGQIVCDCVQLGHFGILFVSIHLEATKTVFGIGMPYR